MSIEIIREDKRSDIGMLHVFQIYDCWLAEEMKHLPCLRLAFRNASRWLVVSGSTKQVRGASIVNRRISMSYFILNKAWCFSQHGS